MDQCWILIGMMGAGKSSVGRALATMSGRDFRDTDTLVQNKLGRSISQIFHIYGEHAFREHESQVLTDLEPGGYVLSTGGGVVCRPENWVQMRRLGAVIYLKASASTIHDRLQNSKRKRPLLDSEDWADRVEAILNSRLPLYEQADMVIDVDGLEVDEVARTCYEALAQS